MKHSFFFLLLFDKNFLKINWIFLFAIAINLSVSGQNFQSVVTDNDGNKLEFPWAGGMNSVQFGELDINRDGIKDLFAFDRMGNRKICFINNGTPGKIDYVYSPEYNHLLPEMFDWMILADYNGDGKEDIFTNSPGWAGMKVFKNVSDNILKFELVVSPYLKSFQGGGYVNLLVTYVDYPGIVDIDNDGDLDIFSFWALGSFLNFHKNLSMEKYGNADSLDYELEEYCWGRFAESDESNEIFLDTCLNEQIFSIEKERHTGSTLLFLDLDNDQDKDLLLGDIDYPGIFSLKNAGNDQLAFITEIDTMFPAITERARIFSMPAAAYIDINNDGKKDLLVSPFDPGLETSENKNSVWLYLNYGENNQPIFELATKNFLQFQMIDLGTGAYPALFDWDNDGLTDLFVGNFGYYLYSFYNQNYILNSVYRSSVSYFKNIGTNNQPEFQMINSDFGNLASLEKIGLVPTFADLTGDQLPEMLTGESNGKLILLKNMGNNQLEVADENYFSIDVGEYSAPQLFDLDRDGLTDLVIGEKNGNLNYYKNQGTNSSPDFVFITDSLGKVIVTDYDLSYTGYSTPWFFRDGANTALIVGSESGNILYYKNIDGNLDGKFELSNELASLLDTTAISFDFGMRTAAAIGEIKKDGKLEMIVGNYSGGLEYINGTSEVLPGYSENKVTENLPLYISPNPAKIKINIEFLPENGNYFYQIYQANGSMISSESINYISGIKISIDISNLQKGLYFIRFSNNSHSIIGKFLVQ